MDSTASASAPYPGVARLSDSSCYPQYSASLKYHFSSNMEDLETSWLMTISREIKYNRAFWETATGYLFIVRPKYLHGLEEFNSDKSKCQHHFDVYKECKKKEREARLERNKKRSLFG